MSLSPRFSCAHSRGDGKIFKVGGRLLWMFFSKTWQGYCTRGFPSINCTHRILKSRPWIRRLDSWWVLEEQCQRASWYDHYTVMILQWMTLIPHSSCQAWWAQWIWKRCMNLREYWWVRYGEVGGKEQKIWSGYIVCMYKSLKNWI